MPAVARLPLVGRRAIRPGKATGVLTPDSRSPSEPVLDAAPMDSPGLVLERYGAPLEVDLGLAGVALGSYLHRAFEVLGARPELVDRLGETTGVAAEAAEVEKIAAAVQRFEAWLARRFAGATLRREWPVLCLDEAGTVVSGTIDLVVETSEGVWILDHKSDAVEDPLRGYGQYERQLEAYALAIARSGASIAGTGIHWTRRGEIVLRATEIDWNCRVSRPSRAATPES